MPALKRASGAPDIVVPFPRADLSPRVAPALLALCGGQRRIPARRLTNLGVAAFREWLRSAVRGEGPAVGRIASPPPYEALFDPATSEPLPYEASADLRPLDSSRDCAEMLRDGFGASVARLRDDKGALDWLALLRVDDIYPADADGTRKAYSALRYMFRDVEGTRADLGYRHLVWTPALLLHELGDEARVLLTGTQDHPSDAVEQVMARPLVRASRGVAKMLALMYLDDAGTGLVRGAGADGGKGGLRRGGVRDCVAVLAQCERSYDLSSMSAQQLLDLLPDEGGFKAHRARARKRLAAEARTPAPIAVAAE